MSSRPQFSPHSVITNGDMSDSLTSEVTIIQKLSMISYDIAWTAGSTPVGTITVQISNTYSQNADGTVKNAGTWTTITLSTTVDVSGNSGNAFIDIEATAGYAMRVIYTCASGSGTLNVTVNGKVA